MLPISMVCYVPISIIVLSPKIYQCTIIFFPPPSSNSTPAYHPFPTAFTPTSTPSRHRPHQRRCWSDTKPASTRNFRWSLPEVTVEASAAPSPLDIDSAPPCMANSKMLASSDQRERERHSGAGEVGGRGVYYASCYVWCSDTPYDIYHQITNCIMHQL